MPYSAISFSDPSRSSSSSAKASTLEQASRCFSCIAEARQVSRSDSALARRSLTCWMAALSADFMGQAGLMVALEKVCLQRG
jgi:hypothetical protein